MKFDLDLPDNLLREVLQVNIVDMGQMKKSKNDLLLFEVIWCINISLSGRPHILQARLYLEQSYQSRSENLSLEKVAVTKFMKITLEERPRASL